MRRCAAKRRAQMRENPSARRCVSIRTYAARAVLGYLEAHPTGTAAKLFERFALQVLELATASAFKVRGKLIFLASDPLACYANFSAACMEKAGEETDRRRLFTAAWKLGRTVRDMTGFTEDEGLTRLVILLYRGIGIEMSGEIPGELRISRCYYSRVYSPEQCLLISAMDAGIVAGICGGSLTFSERLTEGCDHCSACVRRKIR